jgi:hypothetical protein
MTETRLNNEPGQGNETPPLARKTQHNLLVFARARSYSKQHKEKFIYENTHQRSSGGSALFHIGERPCTARSHGRPPFQWPADFRGHGEKNEMQLSQGNTVTMPGKVNFDSGKARFDMNMSEAKGSAMPPQMVVQMKSMGMDTMTSINRPDLKVSYLIYPGLKAYAEMPIQDSTADKSADYKVETTEQGKETLDGHATVKNKVVVTDDQGKKHEYTVWNATDLKKFPVKIETAEEGMNMTMTFKNVKLDKPKADLFNAPSDYKKYDNVMSLMQQEMMKKMQENGGGMGMPPNHP